MLVIIGELNAFMAALEALEARCAVLEDECDRLRRQFGVNSVPAGFMGLSGIEAALLGLILDNAEVTRAAAYSAIYADRRKVKVSVLGAIVSSIRRKIQPAGIEIQTNYGHGYTMSGGSKAILRALIANHHKIRGTA